jgi:hypothetical protein
MFYLLHNSSTRQFIMRITVPLVVASLAMCKGANASNTSTSVSTHIFNDALRARIGDVVQDNNVTGHSVGVLRLTSNSLGYDIEEFAQWGHRTESGDLVQQNVHCLSLASCTLY